MAYDSGALKASLAAAVGEDPALQAELRHAFGEAVRRQLRGLAAARGASAWRAAALRLHSLAASFAAHELMQVAERAASGPCGSPSLLREIEVLIPAP